MSKIFKGIVSPKKKDKDNLIQRAYFDFKNQEEKKKAKSVFTDHGGIVKNINNSSLLD